MTHMPPHRPPTSIELVYPKVSPDGRSKVIVLDPVSPLGLPPPYCVHGKTNCYRCEDWCWLGDQSYEVVRSGEAVGLCVACANATIPNDPIATHVRNVHDHLRTDGPHE